MLTQKAKYALQALQYLVEHSSSSNTIGIQTIAEAKHIPIKFLESILLSLKKAGILESIRGRNGGYFLPESALETKISTILRLLDGPIALISCVSLNFYQSCENCTEDACQVQPIMAEARDAVLHVLENKTIADLNRKS